MFFTIKNKRYLSIEQLRTSTLLKAYYVIKKYPMLASDTIMSNFIQQQYDTDLKNMCIKLLLNMTFYENKSGDLILMFKNPEYDKIARLITYGNGAIPGSSILKTALNS